VEVAEAFDGLERRHAFFEDFFLDRLRPGPRFFEGRERDVAGDPSCAVAAEAVALKDADDFLIECDARRDRLVRAGGESEQAAQRGGEAEPHLPEPLIVRAGRLHSDDDYLSTFHSHLSPALKNR
jgi:hypothetical protein